MKKRIFVLFCSVAAIATVSYMNVGQDSTQSYLLLENVEALAQSEGSRDLCIGTGSVYCADGTKAVAVYTRSIKPLW
jgi:hypothetical protein